MRIVIAGAGPAGVKLAETVRTFDGAAELVMLSSEPYPPYAPPAMVDHFLRGTEAHFWVGHDWPDRLGVDYRPATTLERVEPAAHRLHLAGGATLDYDKLIVATGGRLDAPLDGVTLPGVYNFKSLSAAEALIGHVRRGEAEKAVIVGGGFIGMEIALLLGELGVQVTQLEMLGQVMSRMLDEEAAAIVVEAMRRRGVDVRLHTHALAFEGDRQARGVRLESGDLLEADLFVAATGLRPNLEPLAGSGVECRFGVLVDDAMRTNVPDVYAIGDVAETVDLLTGERFVHAIMPNAVAQAAVAGLDLVGQPARYEGAERMNSLKHLGLPVVVVGLKWGDEVLRNEHDGALRTFYLYDDRLVGFQLIGDTRGAGVLRTLVNRGDALGPLKDRLLQPGFGVGMVLDAATLAW